MNTPRSGTWQLVSSENLIWTRYRTRSSEMDVVFRNAQDLVYTYQNVSWMIYCQVFTAKSVGGEFNRLIRSCPDVHPYTRARRRR